MVRPQFFRDIFLNSDGGFLVVYQSRVEHYSRDLEWTLKFSTTRICIIWQCSEVKGKITHTCVKNFSFFIFFRISQYNFDDSKNQWRENSGQNLPRIGTSGTVEINEIQGSKNLWFIKNCTEYRSKIVWNRNMPKFGRSINKLDTYGNWQFRAKKKGRANKACFSCHKRESRP